MRPDHLEKLNQWFMVEIAALKTEGASEQDFKDPAVADLALRKIFDAHFEQIRSDRDLTDEIFAVVSNQAFPSDLREIAEQAREQGNLGIGHYLELVAAHREGQTS